MKNPRRRSGNDAELSPPQSCPSCLRAKTAGRVAQALVSTWAPGVAGTPADGWAAVAGICWLAV
ncbi:MAG: hypothetical protein HJJLKODD_01979 [Phycisphaerae bacterium]|nr:hypothetical protein [Phycisphaerae bacterium]